VGNACLGAQFSRRGQRCHNVRAFGPGPKAAQDGGVPAGDSAAAGRKRRRLSTRPGQLPSGETPQSSPRLHARPSGKSETPTETENSFFSIWQGQTATNQNRQTAGLGAGNRTIAASVRWKTRWITRTGGWEGKTSGGVHHSYGPWGHLDQRPAPNQDRKPSVRISSCGTQKSQECFPK